MKAGLASYGSLLFVLPCSSNASGNPAITPQQFIDTAYVSAISQSLNSTVYRLTSFDSAQAKTIDDEPKIKLNPKAVTFVNSYLKTNTEALQKVKERSGRYFKIIDGVLKKNNLPMELKYLAVIESELKATAVSRVGAVGPWQLMPATARLLGLKVSKHIDERTHYYKSTVAVCKYLKDLYAEFGDWLLVIAAYNGGPGTVYKAIKKSGSRNFWYLQYYLPAETRGHVKRFIGAHYFFEQEGSETTLTKSELFAYKKALADYEEEKLKELNTVVTGNEDERLPSSEESMLLFAVEKN